MTTEQYQADEKALSAGYIGVYKEELAQLVATVDAGSSADYRALQEHRVMRTARAVLSAAPQPTVRDDTELIRQMRIALTDMAEQYNTDEGCKNLLAYKNAIKAITAARKRLENT